MNSKLLIYTLIRSASLETAIAQLLSPEGYEVKTISNEVDFVQGVYQEKQTVDCLVLESSSTMANLFTQLANQSTLLPVVVIQHENQLPSTNEIKTFDHELTIRDEQLQAEKASGHYVETYLQTDGSYHSAVIGLSTNHLKRLPSAIDRSIVQFLKLSTTESIPPRAMHLNQQFQQKGQQALKQKQHDLSRKLKERLGYVGVYYKRNSAKFLRHMAPEKKREFLSGLREDYREIVLVYFAGDSSLNHKIDAYVNTAFLADVPVAQVVEIHMDLMDDFAKQLQIEGRSEEILLDYRLTLIDLLANLCEIYRRSIPKEA